MHQLVKPKDYADKEIWTLHLYLMLTSYVEEKAMPKEGQQQIPSRFCAYAIKRQVQRRRHASLAPGPPTLQSSEITILLPEKKQCARVGVVIDEEQDGEIFASREHVAPNHSIAVFFSSSSSSTDDIVSL
jgi:hypothetical protein